MSVFEKIETIEIRGVSMEEIEFFFLESGWKNISPGKWISRRGEVDIGDLEEVSLGSIRLPSVTLVFRLGKNVSDEVLAVFRARFLRAGG